MNCLTIGIHFVMKTFTCIVEFVHQIMWQVMKFSFIGSVYLNRIVNNYTNNNNNKQTSLAYVSSTEFKTLLPDTLIGVDDMTCRRNKWPLPNTPQTTNMSISKYTNYIIYCYTCTMYSFYGIGYNFCGVLSFWLFVSPWKIMYLTFNKVYTLDSLGLI